MAAAVEQTIAALSPINTGEASPLYSSVGQDGTVKDPVSCIGWESDGGLTNVPKSVKGKKRARLEERKRAAFPRLGLGTSGGSVLVLDLQTGETTTVGTEHEGKVSSVAWSTQRDVLFSCGIDTRVCKWDLSTGTLSLKWKAQEPLTSMCYSSGDDGAVITAGTRICVWNDDSGKMIEKFSGHAAAVTSLSSVRGKHVVSAVLYNDTETQVYSWLRGGGKKAAKSPDVYSCPGAIVAVDICLLDGDEWRLLAVGVDGLVRIFLPSPTPSTSEKPIAFVSTLKIMTGDVPCMPVPVLNGGFSRLSEMAATSLLIVRGSRLAPEFEDLEYMGKTDETEEVAPVDKTYTREAARAGVLAVNQHKSSMKPRGGPASSLGATEHTVIGATSIVPEGGDITGQTLGEQARQLGITPGTTSTSGDAAAVPAASQAKSGTPTAGSLAHMLAQAIHSNDKALLEECLRNTNEAVVRNTVARLPPTMAVKFLIDIVNKLQARPNRGPMLMVWIRAVLVVHTSYLMTVPDLARVLSGTIVGVYTWPRMYNFVDSRLSVFPRILKLSGRLDLLLSQVLLQSATDGSVDDEISVPLTSYVDDDEDSADDDDDDDDEGVDDGENGDDSDGHDEEDWDMDGGSDAGDGSSSDIDED